MCTVISGSNVNKPRPPISRKRGPKLQETPVIFLNLCWDSKYPRNHHELFLDSLLFPLTALKLESVYFNDFKLHKFTNTSPPLSTRMMFCPWILCLDLLPLKVLMQGKLFQRCTHFLYCSVLSLGGKVNTRRMSQPDMESIFTKIIYEIFWS